jgi:hypothetical protein
LLSAMDGAVRVPGENAWPEGRVGSPGISHNSPVICQHVARHWFTEFATCGWFATWARRNRYHCAQIKKDRRRFEG